MTATLEASYQPLQAFGSDGDVDETPHDSGVVIHVVPESSRARWNHMEDLDAFFTRMYLYHQKHGFACMMLQEVLELLQFIFVVVFSMFLFHCVDYPILFRDKVISENSSSSYHKISMSDVVIPVSQCVSSFSVATWLCLLVAFVFWLLRAFKVLYHIFQFWDIKSFFNSALKISDSDLDNLTWHEVQKRVREVQKEQQMCIHKTELTELDIYHRILRYKNYMVAMVNKSLLPARLQIPVLGEVVFLTHGLKYNLELLLFWGPWAPFENSWHLKEDYKKTAKRHELASALSKHILWLSIVNFILCPLILLWQILYCFFNYAEIIKREPGMLGSRCWSLYGRLYLRHFNELDHELNARLNRAYRPASKYMHIFTSPLMTVIAKNVMFVAGAPLAVLLLLTVIDEDTLTAEHVLTTMTVLGAVVAACRVFIADENMVWCPETLMTAILAHVHYLPDTWRGHAHTNRVRDQFSQLFQYRAVHLLEELLSPIITPLVLCFYVRSRALEFVDFYRNFTVDVIGVGDVCSFAQMDVRRHGNPAWQTVATETKKVGPSGTTSPSAGPGELTAPCGPNQYTQAEDGKTELSLVHFTMTNPHWQPPPEAETFVAAVRNRTREECIAEVSTYPHLVTTPFRSGSSLEPEVRFYMPSATVESSFPASKMSCMMTSHLRGSVPQMPSAHFVSFGQSQMVNSNPAIAMRGGLSRAEGPCLPSVNQHMHPAPALGASIFGSGVDVGVEQPTEEFSLTGMSSSTLLLHELHHRQLRRRGFQERESSSRALWQRPHQEMSGIREEGVVPGPSLPVNPAECTPLLQAKLKAGHSL